MWSYLNDQGLRHVVYGLKPSLKISQGAWEKGRPGAEDRGTRITRLIIFLAIGPPCLRNVVHWSTDHSCTRSDDRLPTSGGGLPKLAEQGPCDFPLSNNRVLHAFFIPKTSQQVHGVATERIILLPPGKRCAFLTASVIRLSRTETNLENVRNCSFEIGVTFS
jgi:hypothetical protein